MDRYEYMRIPAKDIPTDIMEQYNLAPLVHKGHVLTEIQKGMYGLPQAGILAYNRLVTHLALSGYTPVQHTPGLFRHATRPVTFSLVVDDYAITPGLPPLMAPKSSSPHRLTTPNHSTLADSPTSNESSAPSCFTDAPLTALFLSLSVLSQQPNPKEQLPQPRPSPSSSTTVPPIQMPPYGLLPAKCTSTFTATLPTFRKFAPAPVQVATSFSATSPRSFHPSPTTHRHLSMAPSMFTHPS